LTRRIYKVLLIITLTVCTALFAKEIKPSGIYIDHADKVAHFGVFFVLAFITHHATRSPIWFQLCLLIGYGVTIEYMQSALPYRQASIGDFVADVVGASSYYISYFFWKKISSRMNG